MFRKLNYKDDFSQHKHFLFYIKVKQSLYRPGQALSIPGGWGPRFHENRYMKVVRSAFRTRRLNYPGYIPERLSLPKRQSAAGRIMSMKISATFRFMAQCLNKLRHRVHQL
jgi:hypothetical protein